MKLIFSGPVNSLSFGNVTINILRVLWKRGVELTFFPIGNHLDFKAFDKVDKDFAKWLADAAQNRLRNFKRDIPSIRLWHLNGSEQKHADQQYLVTFYEMNAPTVEERAVTAFQTKTLFSCKSAKQHFENMGLDNVENIPMGFDPDFKRSEKKFYPDEVIHFGLMGKWEKRKHTEKIIQLWAKKYGHMPNYRLSCCVVNPFYKSDQMNGVISQALGGEKYTNINFLPYLTTNSEVNNYHNAIDIDLGGLSGGEGWNLPAFNSTCLGKWSIVLNATAHKDWATKDNSILVNPNGQTPAYDGIFFKEGTPFNQGSIYTFDDEEVIAAFEAAEKKAKTVNENGVKLGKEFSYDRTVDEILSHVK